MRNSPDRPTPIGAAVTRVPLAAVSAARHIYHARSLLPHVIDRLGLAIALFDVQGNEVHRTPELCAVLADNPDAPLVVAAMRSVVTKALALRGLQPSHADHAKRSG